MQLPSPQANLAVWAKDVYNYLSYKEREQFDAAPARLAHLLPNTKARPSADGVLMYDPALSGVVMSKNKQWQPLLASSVGTIIWDQVTDKPSEFAPSAHTHLWADITDKPIEFAPSAHTHLWADITDKPIEFAPSAHTHLWADITDKPIEFAPSAHTHLWAEITDKPIEFAPSAHTHLWAEITDKPIEFAPSAHTHLWAEITDKPIEFAPSAHTHLWAEITDKPIEFAPSAHTHTVSEIADFSPADYLPLIGGVVTGNLQVQGNATTRANVYVDMASALDRKFMHFSVEENRKASLGAHPSSPYFVLRAYNNDYTTYKTFLFDSDDSPTSSLSVLRKYDTDTLYATAAQGSLASSAVQPGDDVSDLAETATAKIMTGVERTKLAGLSASVASHCRYTNSDTATDISTATFIRIPLAGAARETHPDFTMNAAGDQLTVNFTGVVQVFAFVSQGSSTARAGVEIGIWSDGTLVSAIQQASISPLTGYRRDAASMTSVFAVTSGDIIEIRGRECGAAATVTQTGTWSSLCATRIS